MKKLLLTASLSLACVCAFAQGTLNFANAGAGVNAPVSDAAIFGGAKLAGSAFLADLFWGPAGTTDSSALTALGAPSTFSAVAAQAGYFFGGARTITGVAGGSTIVAQVRAWDAADGATYAQAMLGNPATARVGASILFNVTLSTPPSTPANLTGLGTSGFQLQPIPEPSTMALAGLGAAALLIFRRRK